MRACIAPEDQSVGVGSMGMKASAGLVLSIGGTRDGLAFVVRLGARKERWISIVTDRGTTSGRQRTARRFAVGRRWRLGASSTLAGHSGPAFGPLLPSRHLRPIPSAADAEDEPYS